ncbi:MAG: hypothetical protein QW702_01645 [Candidatus Bathyarchaeia archaeon]
MDKVKKLIGLSIAAVILLSLLAPILVIQPVAAADPTEWYMTVSGVLDSDYYKLYPFESKSLTIGLSKFGELIDANTKKGLEYDGVDPFASDPYVPEFEWNQGWVINITYAYGGWFRNVWAFALYSDSWGAGSIGGNWKRAPAADSATVIGGRKYGGWSADGEVIGYVETDPLQVLYDGPRLFVALSRTTIYEDTAKQNPLVRLDLTFVFEKVKKYVIVFKDIKRLDTRKFSSDFQVEFSNRGEWDLGKVQTPKSYAHFFNDQPTCYHMGWHPYYPNNAYYDVIQIISADTPGYVGFAAFWPKLISKYVEATTYITRKTMLTTLETYIAKFSGDGSKTVFQITAPHPAPIEYPRGDGVWSDEPMVFVNGKLQAPTGKVTEWSIEYPYIWDHTTNTVTFINPPPAGTNNVWFVYKRYVHKVDMSVEPAVPYVIGEWDFDLPNKPNTQFRAVTVYGIVNYHDAVDDRVIDREVKYLLDEVFNPWDLNDAVHKETKRWVEFFTGDGIWSSKTLARRPVVRRQLGAWYEYCSFAERVLVDGALLTPTDARLTNWWPSFPYTYNITVGADGKATITFYKDKDGKMSTLTDLDPWKVEKGKVVKVLYSTLPNISGWHWSEVWNSTTINNAKVNVPIPIEVQDISDEWDDNLGVTHDISLSIDALDITLLTTGKNWTATYSRDILLISESDFKVFVGETHITTVRDIYSPIKGIIGGGNATIYLDVGSFVKSVSDAHDSSVTWPLANETVHVDYLDCRLYVWINVTFTTYPDGSNKTTINAYISVDSYYGEHLGGRYEWTIVGRDAHTVDSAGAALVTAAFKNKQVEIGLAGADMMETTIANAMPWVMHKFGTGNTKADYKDAIGRAALKDDWCTTWPVASSNLIAVGGPLANILAYYANDFTPAFFGLEEYAASVWDNKIIALSCWSKNTYASNEMVGYAVVTTYKDINGTVMFLIWGHWGRDTYYATKWFHEEGIYQLQEFPDCATAIILEINYEDPEHPTVSVVEVLGTISETLAHKVKGGIHVDP